MRGRPRRSPTTSLLALAAAAALALSGCSDSDEPAASSGGSPSPAVDAFTALLPPSDTRIGRLDPIVSRRAFEKTRGLLALSLAEVGTLTGAGTEALREQLRVRNATLSVEPLLAPRPTARALAVRPLFAPTVTVAQDAVEVVRSSYRGEEVRGLGGESGIRISWDGAVRYRVSVGGRAQEVAYALKVAYVYGPVPTEVGGLELVQVVPGSFHAAPVLSSCLREGVLLPTTGTPGEGDYGPGPWPSPPAGAACPF